jgi:hypothetical protein
MTKWKALRLCLWVLAIIIAGSLFASTHEVLYTYYSNSTFTTSVGSQDFDCNDVETDTGSFSAYRTVDVYRCSDGLHQDHNCQEFDFGTLTWINVTCP